MESSYFGASATRWRARPLLSHLVWGVVVTGPVIAAACVAIVIAPVVPMFAGAVGAVGRWGVIGLVALCTAFAAQLALRAVQPLAVLLDLDIGFPSACPSRLRVAVRAATRRPSDDPPGVADQDIAASAEHVMTEYASTVRSWWRSRSHLSRVRPLAALVAARLHLPEPERDRLQWALLMREIGAVAGDRSPALHPLVGWLGPYAGLLWGPFAQVASHPYPPVVQAAAHAAAVSDAYVVISDVHPNRRSMTVGQAGKWLKDLTGHHLLPEAIDALLTLPERRRQRAMGRPVTTTAALDGVAPTPWPVLTLASVTAVLLVAGIGSGPTATPVVRAGGPVSDDVTVPDRVVDPAEQESGATATSPTTGRVAAERMLRAPLVDVDGATGDALAAVGDVRSAPAPASGTGPFPDTAAENATTVTAGATGSRHVGSDGGTSPSSPAPGDPTPDPPPDPDQAPSSSGGDTTPTDPDSTPQEPAAEPEPDPAPGDPTPDPPSDPDPAPADPTPDPPTDPDPLPQPGPTGSPGT